MHGNVVDMFSLFYGKMLAEMQKKWLTYQGKQYIILTFVVNMRKWRNWQTRRLQVPVVAIPCGFKSRLPHFFYLDWKRLSLIEAGVFFAIKQKVESCKDNPGMIY